MMIILCRHIFPRCDAPLLKQSHSSYRFSIHPSLFSTRVHQHKHPSASCKNEPRTLAHDKSHAQVRRSKAILHIDACVLQAFIRPTSACTFVKSCSIKLREVLSLFYLRDHVSHTFLRSLTNLCPMHRFRKAINLHSLHHKETEYPANVAPECSSITRIHMRPASFIPVPFSTPITTLSNMPPIKNDPRPSSTLQKGPLLLLLPLSVRWRCFRSKKASFTYPPT